MSLKALDEVLKASLAKEHDKLRERLGAEPWTVEKARKTLTKYEWELLQRDALSWALSLLEWRPIETAPRDGTAVLIWEAQVDCASVAWWELRCWWSADGERHPTHWRPIGPGPEAK